MDFWALFCKTGKISDYLKYKASEEETLNGNIKGIDNP